MLSPSISTIISHAYLPFLAISTLISHAYLPFLAISTLISHAYLPFLAISTLISHAYLPFLAISTLISHADLPFLAISTNSPPSPPTISTSHLPGINLSPIIISTTVCISHISHYLHHSSAVTISPQVISVSSPHLLSPLFSATTITTHHHLSDI
ncbi:hypothetical protein O3P69_006901 [Scylla paramamosain]|uniref:Uncharacterized protein n=1 Tax=Scylla paramamosain TaxID=85552 RepID=A0AAW0U1Q2_SCYPA